MKIKKLARALREAIGADPALAKPSYQWCQQQVAVPNSLAFTDWEKFVAACKAIARKAG